MTPDVDKLVFRVRQCDIDDSHDFADLTDDALAALSELAALARKGTPNDFDVWLDRAEVAEADRDRLQREVRLCEIEDSRLESLVARYREALTRYGHHDFVCPAGRGKRNDPGPCSCGLDGALAGPAPDTQLEDLSGDDDARYADFTAPDTPPEGEHGPA